MINGRTSLYGWEDVVLTVLASIIFWETPYCYHFMYSVLRSDSQLRVHMLILFTVEVVWVKRA